MAFCGWVFMFCFGCALWLGIGLDTLSLSVLFVSSLGIFAAISATTPSLPGDALPGRRGIELLILYGQLAWIWQTGLANVDASLFLAVIFLGYLLASPTYIDVLRVWSWPRRRGRPMLIISLASLLVFGASIAWLWALRRV